MLILSLNGEAYYWGKLTVYLACLVFKANLFAVSQESTFCN